MKNKPVWILELVVKTDRDNYVNEPIGVFSSSKKADFYKEKTLKGFENKAECNVLPMFLDESPPILEFVKETKKDAIDDVLYSLYEVGAFEQMVEPDGSFSYSLKKEFQDNLEKIISREI